MIRVLISAMVDQQLQLARDRLVALDRECAETRATIAEFERRTGGPQLSTADGRVVLFASLFRGRPDVFATRWESRTQPGRSGWAPRCVNEWRPGVCEKPRVKCAVCTQRRFVAFAEAEVRRHLEGRQTIGIYPLLSDETCRLVAIDLDGPSWREDAAALRECAGEFSPLPEEPWGIVRGGIYLDGIGPFDPGEADSERDAGPTPIESARAGARRRGRPRPARR